MSMASRPHSIPYQAAQSVLSAYKDYDGPWYKDDLPKVMEAACVMAQHTLDLVEQLEAAEKTLREIGRTYDGVTPIFRKTGTKLLGADAFTYAPDICEALNQARRWTVSYPAERR